MTMDPRYANALRNATNAWAENRTADFLTMQELRRHGPGRLEETQIVTAPNATQTAILQPELARFGHLGTRLNLFA